MLVVLTIVLTSFEAWGGKPPKDPPNPPPLPESYLFFRVDDALGKVALPSGEPTGVDYGTCTRSGTASLAEPSGRLHAGSRLLANVCDTGSGLLYPDGVGQKKLVVIDEATGEETILVDDLLFELAWNFGGPVWVPGDGSLSFRGVRWSQDTLTGAWTVEEAGVYVIELAYDSGGAIAGAASAPVLVASCATETADNGIVLPLLRQIRTWSPDGTRLVVRYAYEEGLWIHDVATPEERTFLCSDAAGADWSPDGATIVYADAATGALRAIRPDGGADVVLIQPGRSEQLRRPRFSPDGQWIAFISSDTRKWVDAVKVATADGKNVAKLFSGLTLMEWVE
jgi:hypothetical protein